MWYINEYDYFIFFLLLTKAYDYDRLVELTCFIEIYDNWRWLKRDTYKFLFKSFLECLVLLCQENAYLNFCNTSWKKKNKERNHPV